MSQRDLYFIVNPQAAHGKVQFIWQKFNPQLYFPGRQIQVLFTKGPGDATQQTRKILNATAKPILIIAVGGDGTLHEVVNGFFHEGDLISSEGALGFLPIGTGCDFSRNPRVPRSPQELFSAIDKQVIEKIDLGHLHYLSLDGKASHRYFINMINIGVGGLVARHLSSSSKKWGSFLTYFKDSIKGILSFRACGLLLKDETGNNVYRDGFQNIAIANGKYCGGGMKMAPDCQLTDGKLRAIVVRQRSKLTTLYLFGTVYGGHHIRTSHVFSHISSQWDVGLPENQSDIYLEADGEFLGRAPCQVVCLKAALPFLVTEGSAT